MLPSVFVGLDLEERAFIIASIDFRIEKEKKEAKEAKQWAGRGRGGRKKRRR